MTWVLAFCAVTLALIVAAVVVHRPAHAVGFFIVLSGLGLMAVFREDANGIIAFAIWTLASYLLINFPLASMLYLVSAFCYTLQMTGHFNFAIQVFSNILGLAGLAAIWYGKPKWRYVGIDWSRHWGGLAVAFNDEKSNTRHPERNQEKAQ